MLSMICMYQITYIYHKWAWNVKHAWLVHELNMHLTVSSCTNNGDIRLVGGATPEEGRVELCNANVWGTVCDDYWESADAGVVCRQLGFSPQGATAFGDAHFGQGAGSIWLDDVNCVGTESRLTDCPASAIGEHNCGHHEDAGVRCTKRM